VTARERRELDLAAFGLVHVRLDALFLPSGDAPPPDQPTYPNPCSTVPGGWSKAACLALRAAPVLLAVVLLAGCGGQSESAHLTAALKAGGHQDVSCGKVGIIAFAGGRNNLYGCGWATATDAANLPISTVERCMVWADGSAYDVTRQTRLIFRAQGQQAPC